MCHASATSKGDLLGAGKRPRVDMQVRPVRAKVSRSIIGAQRPLQWQSHWSLPPQPRYARVAARPLRRTASDVGTLLSLLCFRRGVWGRSSRRFAFGGVSPLLSAANPAQIASTPHAIVFSKAGKTILDPSTRTVHSPPELNQWRPIPGSRGPHGQLDRLTCRYTKREGRL